MEINEKHLCVYCGEYHGDVEAPTQITCENAARESTHQFVPAGDTVLLGQIVDGQAVVSIHEDVSGDEIALLMSAFVDRISTFEHIKRDPTVIMKALMQGVSGQQQ